MTASRSSPIGAMSADDGPWPRKHCEDCDGKIHLAKDRIAKKAKIRYCAKCSFDRRQERLEAERDRLRKHPYFRGHYTRALAWLKETYTEAWRQAKQPRGRSSSTHLPRLALAVAAANAGCSRKSIASRKERIQTWVKENPGLALIGLRPPID